MVDLVETSALCVGMTKVVVLLHFIASTCSLPSLCPILSTPNSVLRTHHSELRTHHSSGDTIRKVKGLVSPLPSRFWFPVVGLTLASLSCKIENHPGPIPSSTGAAQAKFAPQEFIGSVYEIGDSGIKIKTPLELKEKKVESPYAVAGLQKVLRQWTATGKGVKADIYLGEASQTRQELLFYATASVESCRAAHEAEGLGFRKYTGERHAIIVMRCKGPKEDFVVGSFMGAGVKTNQNVLVFVRWDRLDHDAYDLSFGLLTSPAQSLYYELK